MNASPSLLDREYRLYRKRIARCRTENQVNRVHIVLGNYMTPVEVRYFGARSPATTRMRRAGSGSRASKG